MNTRQIREAPCRVRRYPKKKQAKERMALLLEFKKFVEEVHELADVDENNDWLGRIERKCADWLFAWREENNYPRPDEDGVL